ncbi:MAG TPA: gas vesicle protein GvpJ [Gemmatimonadaceae bacterium]
MSDATSDDRDPAATPPPRAPTPAGGVRSAPAPGALPRSAPPAGTGLPRSAPAPGAVPRSAPAAAPLPAPLPPPPDLPAEDAPRSLVELVNRVLDRGVVVAGDVTISVAGVDLVYLGLNALLTSVSTARRTLRGHVAPGERRLLPESHWPETVQGHGITADTGGMGGAVPPGSVAQAEGAGTIPAPAAAARPVADALAAELAEVAEGLPERIDIDPDAVQRDLARLVLVVVELLRRVVEHQAIQRMGDEDLSEAQIERMGVALERLEAKLAEIKAVFGVADTDLNIDLGQLGKLL